MSFPREERMTETDSSLEPAAHPMRCGDEWDDFVQREVAHTCDDADVRMPATTDGAIIERRRRDR